MKTDAHLQTRTHHPRPKHCEFSPAQRIPASCTQRIQNHQFVVSVTEDPVLAY